MAQVAGPYGLRPVKLIGGLPFAGEVHSIPLTANQTSGYFYGDPVTLVGGQPIPITATPTTANTGVLGIFLGVEYMDPVRGFVNAQYFPAGAINAGATKVKLKIADNPELVMQVQANGQVLATQIGLNLALVGPFANGNLATGNSVVALDTSALPAGGAATVAVRIYDFVYNAAPSPGASSMPGDAFTDCLVIWNQGVHRYDNATGQ